MSSRRRLSISILLVGVLVVGSGILSNKSSKSHKSLKTFNNQTLNWKNCYDGFECSTFEVPVDYRNIDSRTFTLQVLRHSAQRQENRLGTIIVNPGGPGGSATDYAYNAQSIVSNELNQRYDIVGFDPRGIKGSEPIRCLSNSDEDAFLEAGAFGGGKEEIENLVSISKDFADKCADAAGDRLGHYSTLETAKDLEILRNLLREEKLNFLGKSYGTYLGTVYAALYPNSVGKMVLDGAVAPNLSLRDQELAQAVGFNTALNNYLASEKKFSIEDIKKLLARASIKPLQTENHRATTQSLIITALAASLYNSKTGWKDLTRALNYAINFEDPTGLLKLADGYNSRDLSGNFYNNQNDISIMITCLDWPEKRTLQEMANDQIEFAQKSPIFGPYLGYAGLVCKYWKADALLPTVELANIRTSPILVIGVTQDPATPYDWALTLAKSFKNARLITLEGEGHTGHNRGNKCVDRAVDSYFLTGKLPPLGLICAQSGN